MIKMEMMGAAGAALYKVLQKRVEEFSWSQQQQSCRIH
jgi:hypothetical protein